MSDSYNLVSKLLHWTTALLIFGLLALGFYMAGLEFGDAKLQLYALHKSFGLLVLMLVFVRVVWHILVKKPKSLPTHKKWEKGLSHAVHSLLYLLLFAMPLTGWVMSSAGDFTIKFFGIVMPDIVAKNKELFDFTREMHETIAYVILGVVALHVVGAFKHHFIDRDESLQRMACKNIGFGGGVVMVVIAGLLFLPSIALIARDAIYEEEEGAEVSDNVAASSNGDNVANVPEVEQITSSAPQWRIIPEGSKISFSATQYGQAFSGNFGGIDGQIYFDPENLVQSVAQITVNIAPITTGSDDRDAQAVDEKWFHVKQFPQAMFKTESFEKIPAGSYIAHAKLTIRGVTMPVDMPFTLEMKEESGHTNAVMKAELSLNRLDFGIGQGEWQKTDAIGNEVKVSIEMNATKQ